MVSIAAAASSSVRRSATTSSCGSARWSSVRTVAPSSATQTVRWCRPSMSISSSSLPLCRLSQRGGASLDIRANAGGLKRVGARRLAAPGVWEPWHHGRIRHDRCRRARRPVRDRDLQPSGAAAEPRARGLERDRRPAPPPRRPGAEPGRDREGLRRPRARPVRGDRGLAPAEPGRQGPRRAGAGRAAARGCHRAPDGPRRGLSPAQGGRQLPPAPGPARRGRGPAADGPSLLQRHRARPEHAGPVLPEQPRRRRIRLQGGRVLWDRGGVARRPLSLWRPLMRAVALALLIALVAAPAAAEERITSFDDTVTVRPDASLEVVEDIAVTVEGRQISHGILRDFPTTYTDRLGRRV